MSEGRGTLENRGGMEVGEKEAYLRVKNTEYGGQEISERTTVSAPGGVFEEKYEKKFVPEEHGKFEHHGKEATHEKNSPTVVRKHSPRVVKVVKKDVKSPTLFREKEDIPLNFPGHSSVGSKQVHTSTTLHQEKRPRYKEKKFLPRYRTTGTKEIATVKKHDLEELEFRDELSPEIKYKEKRHPKTVIIEKVPKKHKKVIPEKHETVEVKKKHSPQQVRKVVETTEVREKYVEPHTEVKEDISYKGMPQHKTAETHEKYVYPEYKEKVYSPTGEPQYTTETIEKVEYEGENIGTKRSEKGSRKSPRTEAKGGAREIKEGTMAIKDATMRKARDFKETISHKLHKQK